MKKFETPVVEIEKLETVDVMTTSFTDCDPDCENEGGVV